MKRSRDDSIKPGKGIDGSLGETYSRDHAVDPWNPPAIGDGKVNSRGHGKYTNDESGLTGKASDTPRYDPSANQRDIYEEVCSQDSDAGNRAVKSRGQP